MAPSPAVLSPESADDSSSGIFLSREECVRLLNRVADSCLAALSENSNHSEASSGMEVAAYTGTSGDVESAGEASLVSQVFDALYDELEEVFYSKRGYLIPSRETALVEATGGSATYGETTSEGLTQFLKCVPLQRDDVLVDLGSGLGRLTLQAACSARLRRCVGIELSASRHEQACWVAARLAELGSQAASEDDAEAVDEEAGSRSRGEVQVPPAGQSHSYSKEHTSAQGGLLLSPVELRCEDLMTADLADGTAFFLCSTAFSAAACQSISRRLLRHPPFRLLVTTRALPFPSPLTLVGQFKCTYSWTTAGTGYVYVRSLGEAPPGLLAAFLSDVAPPGGETSEVAVQLQGARGGIAWLPSTSTLSVVPVDLMV